MQKPRYRSNDTDIGLRID